MLNTPRQWLISGTLSIQPLMTDSSKN